MRSHINNLQLKYHSYSSSSITVLTHHTFRNLGLLRKKTVVCQGNERSASKNWQRKGSSPVCIKTCISNCNFMQRCVTGCKRISTHAHIVGSTVNENRHWYSQAFPNKWQTQSVSYVWILLWSFHASTFANSGPVTVMYIPQMLTLYCLLHTRQVHGLYPMPADTPISWDGTALLTCSTTSTDLSYPDTIQSSLFWSMKRQPDRLTDSLPSQRQESI